jgi:hypothetical protein
MTHSSSTATASRLQSLARLPELNVAVFALLLNFPLEFLQVPLFEGMADARHWDAIKACTRASLGDVIIMLVAFWVVSAAAASRRWMAAPRRRHLLLLVATGLVVTVVIEWLALRGQWLGGWAYAAAMPIVPGLGVGLSPLVQWIVLPPLVVWFARRQSVYPRRREGAA